MKGFVSKITQLGVQFIPKNNFLFLAFFWILFNKFFSWNYLFRLFTENLYRSIDQSIGLRVKVKIEYNIH